MEHFRFKDVIKDIAGGGWGRKFETSDDAERYLIWDQKEEGILHCLLYFVELVEAFLDVHRNEARRMAIKDMRRRCVGAVDGFIEEREGKHGPCPEKVEKSIRSKAAELTGRALNSGYDTPSYYYCTYLLIPNKGSTAREEYDKWMRRRIKKSES
jgi:hypothetical protein